MSQEFNGYDFEHGAKSSIGTTALQLSSTNFYCRRGVTIIASSANTGTVYVGKSDVTNGSADATDGFPLAAGSSITLEIDALNKIYVIGSAAGQKVFYAAV